MSKMDLNFDKRINTSNDISEKKTHMPVDGSARIRQKGPFKKFFSNLIKNDLKTVVSDTTDNVLLPSFAEVLVSVLESIIEGVFLDGGTVNTRTGIDIPYGSVFKSGKRMVKTKLREESTSTSLAYEDVIFTTARGAQDVYENMKDYIEKYHKVSIVDLYSFIKDVIENPEEVKDGAFTEDNYGWKTMEGIRIKPVRGGGYIIIYPRAKYIN